MAKDRFSLEDFLLIEKAVEIAEKMHQGQLRRSGEPYLVHPVAVAETLLNWGEKKEMILAAILHDTLEDTSLTLPEIERVFGSEVSFFVFVLTKELFDIQKNISFFKENPEGLRIKLADRIHNMMTLDSMPEEKQIQKARETLSLYIPLARHFQMFDVVETLQKLCKKYI
ncbi:MAG: HD domain-containing protein [Candidatus Peregrinibacteria bacterium]